MGWGIFNKIRDAWNNKIKPALKDFGEGFKEGFKNGWNNTTSFIRDNAGVIPVVGGVASTVAGLMPQFKEKNGNNNKENHLLKPDFNKPFKFGDGINFK